MVKKAIIAFAVLVSMLFLCSCGQGDGATSVITRTIYSDPRTSSDAVLVADVNKVWDEIVEAPHTSRLSTGNKHVYRCDFVVLECTVRTVLEEQKGDTGSIRSPQEGEPFFLWIHLWTTGKQPREQIITETLENVESVVVWGNWEAKTLQEKNNPTFAEICEYSGAGGADGTVTVVPSLWAGFSGWRIIPLANGRVDVSAIEQLQQDLNYRFAFELSETPLKQEDDPDGFYFADGQSETELIAAIQKFEARQDFERALQSCFEYPGFGVTFLVITAVVTLILVVKVKRDRLTDSKGEAERA